MQDEPKIIDVSGHFLEKLELTAHAQEQMDKRGISFPTVKAAVARGASSRGVGGVTRFNLMGFVVVLDGYKVVTTYEV